MASFLALPDIKRIRVYLNGDPNQVGTNFIVHPRRIRSYEVFLKELTEKMRPCFGAVRSVYTPTTGSRVRDLEDLENNQNYVASGHDAFHKLDYVTIEQTQAMRKATKKVNKSPPKVAKSQKSIRKRPYGWEPITFYIYRNGDDVSPAVKLSVRRSDLENWEHLLLRAGEKLDQSGYVKRLYTMTGDWVRGPNGIKNGEYYVAVGGYEAFKHVMYGKLLERLPKEFIRETAPRPRRKPKAINQADKDPKEAPKKTVPKIKAPPISRKPRPVPVNTTMVTTTTTTAKTMAKTNPSKTNKKSIGSDKGKENKGTNKPSNISTTKKPHREVSFKPTTQPPPKTRLNNKDSEDSAYVSDGEGWNKSRNTKRKSFEVLNGVPAPRHVYYASSAQKSRQKRVTLVNYDEDQGGVYKAKTNTDETSKAREVQELRDLPVELPIDEVEATEVGEEVNKYSDDEYSDYEEPDQQESDPPSEQQYSYPIEHAEVQMASSPLRTMSA